MTATRNAENLRQYKSNVLFDYRADTDFHWKH